MASPPLQTEVSPESARESLMAISQTAPDPNESSPESPKGEIVNGEYNKGAEKYRSKLISISETDCDDLPEGNVDKESLENYSDDLQKVAHCILGFMAKNLGVNPDKLTQFYRSQSVRINYYPPCPDAHDKVIGVTPHADAGGLTLLLQTSSVAGLQIMRNGVWLRVNPLPDAFVVNIGDSLEVLINGKYKSIMHRAIINADKERMSIAGFLSPSFGETIGPLAEVVGDGKPLYKTVSLHEVAKLFYSRKLSKSLIDQLKLDA